jgi:hypothetical protein
LQGGACGACEARLHPVAVRFSNGLAYRDSAVRGSGRTSRRAGVPRQRGGAAPGRRAAPLWQYLLEVRKKHNGASWSPKRDGGAPVDLALAARLFGAGEGSAGLHDGASTGATFAHRVLCEWSRGWSPVVAVLRRGPQKTAEHDGGEVAAHEALSARSRLAYSLSRQVGSVRDRSR